MKKLTSIAILLIISVVMFRCSKTPRSVETSNKTSGSYVFYTRSDLKAGKINVYIDDVLMGQVSKYYPNAPITCDAGLSLTIEQQPGTHTYRAVGETGVTWTGSVDFVSGKCANYELNAGNADTVYTPCINNMDGTWRRINDAEVLGAEGMIVEFKNGSGVITYVPVNTGNFKVGDVKWNYYDFDNCRISTRLTNGSYSSRDIKFFNKDHIRINYSVEYVRE